MGVGLRPPPLPTILADTRLTSPLICSIIHLAYSPPPLPVWPARSIAHPRDSDEWKAMHLDQKYEFFAPIWRIMRDDNMAVDEVRKQIEYVALSVKRGSEVRAIRGDGGQ